MSVLSRKHAGAYYTPDPVVETLVQWAVRETSDRLLDPSCGDGRFIAAHPDSVGIEQDVAAATLAMQRAPWALVHEGDFFAWATHTNERFECAAGNPPFIRYQTFKGEVRQRALDLCSRLGANFSGLASSWAPFLVATASLLKPGGRMAFVVPAEIGHAPYAAPLLDYLVEHFDRVQIIAVRDKLFPELSEDCWLLHAEGFGGRSHHIHFAVQERFQPTKRPPRSSLAISLGEWRDVWGKRLRPYLLPESVRLSYELAAAHPGSKRFGDIAAIGIGYVSGANDFFHLRPSEADRWGIPSALLHPSVRTSRVLPLGELTQATIHGWHRDDLPMMLLRIPKQAELPQKVRRYLDSAPGKAARTAYKCRMRAPWYSVPDVQIPDFFLSYMSGLTPNLVKNGAGATCTNTVHSVRVRDRRAIRRVINSWESPIVRLSCELEGHPLGGGMLKLEPREASQILLPATQMRQELSTPAIEEALWTMRRWRHYATGA